jgi:hypothetical protein
LDREGLTVAGAKGFVRPHPCIVLERDSRLAVARLFDLEIDGEPPAYLRGETRGWEEPQGLGACLRRRSKPVVAGGGLTASSKTANLLPTDWILKSQ